MTTYGAYDEGLPCKNPACKSHGQPHPNCRCYPGLSEGGDVLFCASYRPHDPACEYYADGGDVLPRFDDLKEDVPATKPVMFDDLKDDHQEIGTLPSFDDLQDDQEKYGSPTQQLISGAEGFAQGELGPLATAGELGLSKLGVPGMTREDIKGREEANPWTHGLSEAAGLGTGFLTGTGEAGLAMKLGANASKALELPKVGSLFLKNLITNNMITGLDDVSKYILDQGDPSDAVGAAIAHQTASGLFSAVGSGAGLLAAGGAKSKLAAMAEEKWGTRAQSFLEGLGAASESVKNPELMDFSKEAAKAAGLNLKYHHYGELFHDTIMSHFPYVGEGLREGYKEDGLSGALEYGLGGLLVGTLAHKVSKKILVPAVAKILSSGETSGSFDAINHAADIAAGSKAIGEGINALFTAGTVGASKLINKTRDQLLKDRETLDDKIGDGGVTQDLQDDVTPQKEYRGFGEGFAKGGEVEEPIEKPVNGVALHYPAQNILMQAAKGRISQYLGNLRPHPLQQKLAFDDSPDQRQQTKSYHLALDIANHPLSVLDEVKRGTIEPEHIQHLSALYPEVQGLLQKKLTERITKAQMDGEKPSYKVRQGLSLLLGTPLSSEFTPQNIQAAQAVFQAKGQSAQQPLPAAKNKKSSSALTKSDQSFLTGSQALQKRYNKM